VPYEGRWRVSGDVMFRRISILTIVFAAVIAGTALIVAQAQRVEEALPASVGDLTSVRLLEVRDGTGQVLLHGTFSTSDNSPKSTERKAELMSPTGQKSKGKAEIEIERKDGVVTKDEIEVTMERVPAMSTLSLVVDGLSVASFMTTKGGRADVKLSRKSAIGNR
jgi:hypothetical protein